MVVETMRFIYYEDGMATSTTGIEHILKMSAQGPCLIRL